MTACRSGSVGTEVTMRLRPGAFAAIAVTLILLTIGSGGCQPPADFASAERGATITGPRNASGSAGRPNCAIDGDLDYGPSHGYAWAWLDTPTIVTFAEPATIDAVELFLNDLGGRSYSYRLSVSPDGKQWQTVADMSAEQVRGYRIHRFAPVEARALRLDFTETSVEARSYHIVEIAAWRLGDAQIGPLAERWRRLSERRAQENVALLGVASAQEALAHSEVLDRARALANGESFVQELPDGTRALIFRDGRRIIVAIDDDGDMPADATAPDEDSDCFAVDMDGDGVLDRTIDRDDTDGDGVADVMVQTYGDRNTWGSRPFLVVIRDLDRGPLSLWKLHDWGYDQGICQWECDFAGDGWFCMFRRTRDNDRWAAALEAPFCFYDPDGDGLPEETVRLTATDTTLHSARYGINADNDTTEGQLYDYDVSITCLGSVDIPAEAQTTFAHRSGDRAGPFLSWAVARETVRAAAWERALLVWDENDHNVAARRPDRERWEGILNASYRGFPQEGGPPTLRLNKRFELDADNSGRMRLYWWAADGRLHLLGSEQGSMDVDFDYDDEVDLTVEYADTDGDGFFDERTISFPETDLPARRLRGPRNYHAPDAAPAEEPTICPCSYEAIAESWQGELARWTDDTGRLLEALAQAARALGLQPYTAPMDFYRTATPADFPFIERLRASGEARRYYQDVAAELAFAHLVADAHAAGAGQAVTARLVSARRLWHAGSPGQAAERLRPD